MTSLLPLLLAFSLRQNPDSVVARADEGDQAADRFGVAAQRRASRRSQFGPVRDLTPFQGQHWLSIGRVLTMAMRNDTGGHRQPDVRDVPAVNGTLKPVGVAYTERIASRAAAPTTFAGHAGDVAHAHVLPERAGRRAGPRRRPRGLHRPRRPADAKSDRDDPYLDHPESRRPVRARQPVASVHRRRPQAARASRTATTGSSGSRSARRTARCSPKDTASTTKRGRRERSKCSRAQRKVLRDLVPQLVAAEKSGDQAKFDAAAQEGDQYVQHAALGVPRARVDAADQEPAGCGACGDGGRAEMKMP